MHNTEYNIYIEYKNMFSMLCSFSQHCIFGALVQYLLCKFGIGTDNSESIFLQTGL